MKRQLEKLPTIKVYPTTTFNEFVVRFDQPLGPIIENFRKNKIEPGLELERFFPHLKNHLLIAVTEVKSKEQLDRYVKIASEV